MSYELVEKLKCLAQQERQVAADGVLFRRGQPIYNLYLIDTGLIELVRYGQTGSALVLQRAKDGAILAEASVYADRYHCDAVARVPTRLFRIPKPKLIEAISTDLFLSSLWGSYLASAIQEARHRAEILSHRSVAARLDGWLALNDGKMPEKGQWKSVAGEIGVIPEAFYRELSKRR